MCGGLVSHPPSMMSALCPVPFPPHAGGFLAYPFPRLHGSVESEDAEKGDSAEARGMPPKESCSVAGQSAVHATIDCETSVKSKIRDRDLPGGTMRAWDSPRCAKVRTRGASCPVATFVPNNPKSHDGPRAAHIRRAEARNTQTLTRP